VLFADGSIYTGAVGDLKGDDTTGFLSDALTALNPQAPQHPLPTALTAGIYQNFAYLNFPSVGNAIHLLCSDDPLAAQLT
jgi:hypothetical protein